jgi:isoleucyl-tRNA synthetase
MKESGCF